MGFINEPVSSLSDFITKLNTFLVSEGWVSDELNTGSGVMSMHKVIGGGDDVYFQTRWDTASPNWLGIYHSLGFISTFPTTSPGNHTDDSGSGQISGTDATLITGRGADIDAVPIQYWCFTDSDYAHVVVQQDTVGPDFVHFGFGNLDKIGDWTGGAYCYGHRQQTGFTNSVAVLGGSSMLLDGLSVDGGFPQPSNMEEYAATIHAEGLPNQPNSGGTGKWLVAMGNQSSSNLGQDRQSTPQDRGHCIGGYRGCLLARTYGRFEASSEKGLMPGYPILNWYFDRSNGDVMALGWLKDVAGVSVRFFVGGDEITVGSDTWVLFPSFRRFISGSLTNTSAWQGIAYKKVP